MIQVSTFYNQKLKTACRLCLAHINVSALVMDRLCLMSVIICPATELTLQKNSLWLVLKANYGAKACVCVYVL